MEDNCESLGAKINNKNTGTFGIVNTNSFFFSHHINTIEGGMVSTDDEEIYHILLCLREHGWTRRLPNSKFFQKSNNYEDYQLCFRCYIFFQNIDVNIQSLNINIDNFNF